MQDRMLTLIDGTTVKPEDVLGLITLFRVPDEPVPGTKLNRLWSAEGLDPRLIPDTRRPTDVFANACREVETRRANSKVNSHRTEVKVDEVTNDSAERIYQVTRMVRDSVNRVIDHPKAMRLVLDKAKAENGAAATDCIDVQPLDPSTFGALKGLADRILAYYDKNLTTVPGQKIRNALRDYMRILGAENLRGKSGGVYFVPMDGAPILASLQTVVDKLYGYDAELMFLPQLKTRAVAETVGRNHAANVVKECDEMIARISERLKTKNGRVRKDLLTNIMQQRRELGARRKQYAELLGSEQKALVGHFQVLDEQIEALMDAAVAA